MERGYLRDVCCECCDAGTDGLNPGEEVLLRQNSGTRRTIVGQSRIGIIRRGARRGARIIRALGVIRELVGQWSWGL